MISFESSFTRMFWSPLRLANLNSFLKPIALTTEIVTPSRLKAPAPIIRYSEFLNMKVATPLFRMKESSKFTFITSWSRGLPSNDLLRRSINLAFWFPKNEESTLAAMASQRVWIGLMPPKTPYYFFHSMFANNWELLCSTHWDPPYKWK